jgi:hypothetical protein
MVCDRVCLLSVPDIWAGCRSKLHSCKHVFVPVEQQARISCAQIAPLDAVGSRCVFEVTAVTSCWFVENIGRSVSLAVAAAMSFVQAACAPPGLSEAPDPANSSRSQHIRASWEFALKLDAHARWHFCFLGPWQHLLQANAC